MYLKTYLFLSAHWFDTYCLASGEEDQSQRCILFTNA